MVSVSRVQPRSSKLWTLVISQISPSSSNQPWSWLPSRSPQGSSMAGSHVAFSFFIIINLLPVLWPTPKAAPALLHAMNAGLASHQPLLAHAGLDFLYRFHTYSIPHRVGHLWCYPKTFSINFLPTHSTWNSLRGSQPIQTIP